MLAAGFETTVNLLGNGIALLHDHPAERARVVDDPSLWTNVVEEALRLDPPVLLTGRMALRDTEVDGRPVRAGSMVTAILGGANRDPEVFADPLRFDVGRANARDHIAFSAGRHHCLGAQLARMEGEVGLRAIWDRYPDLRLDPGARRRETRILRGFERFPPRCAPEPPRGTVHRCRTGECCCRRRAAVGVLALAAPAVADDAVPRPVLNVDFPDPAVVATGAGPGGVLDRRPRAPRLVAQRRRAVAARPRTAHPQAVVVARRRDLGRRRRARPGHVAALLRDARARAWGRPAGASASPAPTPRAARSARSVAGRSSARRTPGCRTAQDPLLPRDPTLPRAGVIDPSFFRDADGTPYLLYKTDRIPSTVRIVALSPTGQSVAPGATSLELVRSAGRDREPGRDAATRGLRDARVRGRLDAVRLRDAWLTLGHPARLGGGRDRRSCSTTTTTPGLRPGRRRPGRGQRRRGRCCSSTAGPAAAPTCPCVGRGKWDQKPRQRGRAGDVRRRAGVGRAVCREVTGWLRAP